ncbi:toll/interleukin-1 receptor domain-containing protein [Zavarzinella formosa]|uniref:toll/interleukin-1 receptor domain-containing protein n=1 Tax=Zavarzinella formosa TaxID=360055 RepID=UPI0002DE8B02|nr:toll/interleukin-1 receptor domain-containing protein [Zavarzinella formosa]
MPRIFISYRRQDSSHQAGRLYDRLETRFGAKNVFKDVDSIPLGADFRKVLTERVQKCDVLLCLIGDQWLHSTSATGRRLDEKSDFVRIEVEAALSLEIPVIPVLVGGAAMPHADELPETLKELSFRNAIAVRPDPDFRSDIDRLIRGIEKLPPTPRKKPAPKARPESSAAQNKSFAKASPRTDSDRADSSEEKQPSPLSPTSSGKRNVLIIGAVMSAAVVVIVLSLSGVFSKKPDGAAKQGEDGKTAQKPDEVKEKPLIPNAGPGEHYVIKTTVFVDVPYMYTVDEPTSKTEKGDDGKEVVVVVKVPVTKTGIKKVKEYREMISDIK